MPIGYATTDSAPGDIVNVAFQKPEDLMIKVLLSVEEADYLRGLADEEAEEGDRRLRRFLKKLKEADVLELVPF